MKFQCFLIARKYDQQRKLYLQRANKEIGKSFTKEEASFEPVLKALIDVGRIAEARQFLEWTRNARHYSKRLHLFDKLAFTLLGSRKPQQSVLCSDFGCSKEQIQKCAAKIDGDTPVKAEDFCPMELLSMSEEELRSIGIYLAEKKTHRVVIGDFDENKLTDYFCAGFKVLADDETGLYSIYRDCYWQRLSKNSLILPKLFHGLVERIAPSCWTSRLEERFLNALKVKCLSSSQLDPVEDFLSVQNGLIDLKTFKLNKHTWEASCTSMIPVAYDKKAECPIFKQALLTISNNDPTWVMVMQEVIGYCLDPTLAARKMMIFLGKASNGKSWVAECIEALVGSQNVSSLPLMQFQARFGPYALVDSMVNVCTETDTTRRESLKIENLKKIVAGEAIQVEAKGVQGYKCRLRTKIIAAMNDYPDISNSLQAFLDRVLVLPFDVRFSRTPKAGEVQADIHLLDKVKTELPGILNFALEGLKRLRAQKYVFSSCKRVEEAEARFQGKVNVSLRYLRERLIPANRKLWTQDIAQDFTTFCRDEGYPDKSVWSIKKVHQELEKAIKEAGLPYHFGKSNGLSCLRGAAFAGDSALGSEDDDTVDTQTDETDSADQISGDTNGADQASDDTVQQGSKKTKRKK